MKLIKSESAVSEVVGALLVFGIIVIFIGIVQTYQVPVWNAAVEREHFDVVCSDFVELRSDIDDVKTLNIPKSGDLHLGVRYPERFIFRNPGVGASGTITTYPLNVNVSYSTGSVLAWKNYTSTGIVYEVHGASRYPKLVYEHGLILKDYGDVNRTGDEQSLVTGGDVFIPIILWGDYSLSSMDVETFSILPVPVDDCTSTSFSDMNVTLDTRYPDVWDDLSGSSFNVSNGTIEIKNVSGAVLKLPPNDTSQSTQKQCYAGMITIDTSTSTSTASSGPTGPDGADMWAVGQGRIDIPASSEAAEFIIRDITFATGTPGATQLWFVVTDASGTEWKVDVKFSGDDTIDEVKIGTADAEGYENARNLQADGYQINLTNEYRNANITTPNMMTITKDKVTNKGKGLLYVNFLIN